MKGLWWRLQDWIDPAGAEERWQQRLAARAAEFQRRAGYGADQVAAGVAEIERRLKALDSPVDSR